MQLYLPNRDEAYVEPAKVRDYLLLFREANDKPGYFQRFGFRRENWQVLQAALLRHGRSYPVSETKQTTYGVEYSIDGSLTSPDGRDPWIRSV